MSPASVAKELWPWLRKYTLGATAISMTAGAVIAVMNAAGILEPYWITTHGYTRAAVISSEIRALESNRDNLQKQIDALELRIKNTDNASANQVVWREQIERRRDEIRLIEAQLRDLHRQLGNI